MSLRSVRYGAFFRRLRSGRPRFSSWSHVLPWLLVLVLAALLSLKADGPEETEPVPPPQERPPRTDFPSLKPSVPEPAPLEEEEGCPAGCPEPRPGCEIKGNFRREKIYHLPGQKYYGRTVIDPGQGERWFCTEEEAVANGWRKSKV